jgi:hypothetical protein
MFSDCEVISTYTRKQATEDGVLVDVSKTAKEAGFLFPVAVTRGVWNEIIVPGPEEIKYGQSIDGRLRDVLWMLFCAIKQGKSNGDRTDYQVIATKGKKQILHKLYSLCGPGDNGEPVITILLPWED